MQTLTVQGKTLEYIRLTPAQLRPGAPTLVFLHEGLGAISMWRDFPQQVADATGCPAMVYSRYGYGRSTPLSEDRAVDYMHHEALLVLPEVLDQLGIENPILLGHSDGASIALIHAGSAGSAGRPVGGVIVMAPHYFVEGVAIQGIIDTTLAYETTALRQRLGRYHIDGDATFRGWHRIWLNPAFRAWNIAEHIYKITAPILAIQGEGDEYGTMAQIDGIAELAKNVTLCKLPRCGHSPHRDQGPAVIEAVQDFLGRL